MLRVRVQTSGAAVQGYFGESAGEYYAEGETSSGAWGGDAAERLGLTGAVDMADFAALCANRHPESGEPLTPRTKAGRRIGWDCSFHVPKSVSVLYGLTGDADILVAFRNAVSETMVDLEREARTRVRRAGRDADRVTGNLAWATFVHATARPVHGVTDPHLHAHGFAFNLTFDEVEGRFQALQPDGVYRDARYFEACFHARLAANLRGLGFDTTRTATGWEVSGLPYELLRRFSKRSELIERVAAEKGITDAKEKDALGASTRERKRTDRSLADLRAEWWGRLTADERRAILAVLNRELLVESRNPDAARESMALAAEHVYEREAVVRVRTLLAAALRFGVGHVTPERVEAELASPELIVRERDGERFATTPEVAAEERLLLAVARDGRGCFRSLAPRERSLTDDRLSEEQRSAVRHILGSTDRVTLVRGAAGTGKTTLLTECVRGIESAGKRVLLLAPTAEASRGVLRREGFPDADTVARFLADAEFQELARGNVVWVDEAGLLGGRDAARLFRLAVELNARVVLAGDRFQHRSVSRGSVLELLEKEAGLVPAEVTTIRRQSGRYREAVALLSRGRVAAGLDLLDELGWVRELNDDSRTAALVAEYLATVNARKSVLVVAPTHAEGRAVTTAIRDALRHAGKLAANETVLTRLDPLDRSVAERRQPAAYSAGEVVEFNRRAPGFRSGERWTVIAVGKASVGVRSADGRTAVLPLRLADRFGVFAAVPLPLSVGDRVRVTRNGKTRDGKRLDNGSLQTVVGFTVDGSVKLDSGVVLPPTFGHLAHGYVTTSHAAQGKTVDVVLVAESSQSFRAASREQLYVSVSRGRERAVIFTDDKLALRRAVQRSDPRPTATELLAEAVPTVPQWRAWLVRRVRSLGRLAGRVVSPVRDLVAGRDPSREVGR